MKAKKRSNKRKTKNRERKEKTKRLRRMKKSKKNIYMYMTINNIRMEIHLIHTGIWSEQKTLISEWRSTNIT